MKQLQLMNLLVFTMSVNNEKSKGNILNVLFCVIKVSKPPNCTSLSLQTRKASHHHKSFDLLLSKTN